MLSSESNQKENLATITNSIKKLKEPLRKEIYQPFYKALRITRSENTNARNSVMNWFKLQKEILAEKYNSNVYNEFESSSLNVGKVAPTLILIKRLMED